MKMMAWRDQEYRNDRYGQGKTMSNVIFNLVRDGSGHAHAIAIGDQYIAHLLVGTTLNEKNAQKLVDILNDAVKTHVLDDEIRILQQNARSIQPVCPHCNKKNCPWMTDSERLGIKNRGVI